MIRVDETDPVGEIEPAFPYRNVTVRRGIDFNNHYDLQSELGRGKFGTVFLCQDKKNSLRLAVKIVNTVKKEDRRAVEREVEIMRRLQHPRLIQLYDAVDTGKQYYVVLELIEGGELFERVIDDDFVLTERSCAVFMRQICEGIEFVHSQNILHLDMKPENILCLTKEGNRIKIIDFGLARQFDPRKKLQVLFGTPEFVAPEVVNFDQIGYGTDMWSIGVICYVLLSGLSPFMGDTDVETMANVTIAKYDFDHEAFSNISEEAKDFIRCLLVKDKEKRLSATECHKHRWLARRQNQPTSERVKESAEKSQSRRNPKKPEIISTAAMLQPRSSLDLTKDNLKLFVERWRDHPNSPYNLEEDLVQPLETTGESMSLGALSPSTRQSICSSPLGIDEKTYEPDHYLTPTGATLDRRASEGCSNDLHIHDPASQIVLAEEIIKLSKHLRSIAMASSTDGDNNFSSQKNSMGCEEKKTPTRNDNSRSSEVNEITEKLSTITRQRKMNGTTLFNSSRNTSDSREYKLTSFTLKKSTRINENKVVEGKSTNINAESKADVINETDKNNDDDDDDIDLIPPWRRPRTKRRFSETCRDVPRISNLQNIHKDMNLDEPTSAKNLLLQLLQEWDEKPNNHLGRKSISVDWASENIARKSMNSLAEYFQAKQNNKPTGSS